MRQRVSAGISRQVERDLQTVGGNLERGIGVGGREVVGTVVVEVTGILDAEGVEDGHRILLDAAIGGGGGGGGLLPGGRHILEGLAVSLGREPVGEAGNKVSRC